MHSLILYLSSLSLLYKTDKAILSLNFHKISLNFKFRKQDEKETP